MPTAHSGDRAVFVFGLRLAAAVALLVAVMPWVSSQMSSSILRVPLIVVLIASAVLIMGKAPRPCSVWQVVSWTLLGIAVGFGSLVLTGFVLARQNT